MLIPLPPITEQHRIVAKVDELMALCERLEASLAAGEGTRGRLLGAVLAEALAGDAVDAGAGEEAIASAV
jgi:type I restriction enzyme S subunit